MRTSNPMTATLISSITNVLFLWVIALLFLPFDFFLNKGMIYLAIAGLLAPSLARVFMYTGIEKVGVSITSPIKETAQFFAAFAAIVFMGERLTGFIGLATIMTIIGVILLSRSSGNSKLTGQLQWKKKDLIYPFGAAILYGGSRVFRKLGMATVSSYWGGATVMATVSLLFFLILFAGMQNKQKAEINRNCLYYYALGGVLGGLGQVMTLAAFKLGDIVLVGPLVSSTPFFSLLLNYLFLRHLERITVNIFLGVVLIVAAVIILSVMR
jgi:uncharacterized membrane protein